MMLRYKINLILVMIVIFCINAESQDTYRAVVRGQVVDEKGRPVSRASITFDNSETLKDKKCWAMEHELLSDGAGQFWLQEYCTVANRTIVVFIEAGDLPLNAQFPISAPFWHQLRKNNPRFAGLPINLEDSKHIDLGKIPVQVWYNVVELFVIDANGRPFYKTEDDWAKFVLIVRDELGDAVGSEGLSNFDLETSVRIDRGSVRLALPEGTWTLELLSDWDDIDTRGKTRRNLAKTTVSVKKSDVGAQTHLVVK